METIEQKRLRIQRVLIDLGMLSTPSVVEEWANVLRHRGKAQDVDQAIEILRSAVELADDAGTPIKRPSDGGAWVGQVARRREIDRLPFIDPNAHDQQRRQIEALRLQKIKDQETDPKWIRRAMACAARMAKGTWSNYLTAGLKQGRVSFLIMDKAEKEAAAYEQNQGVQPGGCQSPSGERSSPRAGQHGPLSSCQPQARQGPAMGPT